MNGEDEKWKALLIQPYLMRLSWKWVDPNRVESLELIPPPPAPGPPGVPKVVWCVWRLRLRFWPEAGAVPEPREILYGFESDAREEAEVLARNVEAARAVARIVAEMRGLAGESQGG